MVELAGDFRIDDEGAVFIRVPHRTRGGGLRMRYSPLVEERLRRWIPARRLKPRRWECA
jgi:hypothetical protein